MGMKIIIVSLSKNLVGVNMALAYALVAVRQLCSLVSDLSGVPKGSFHERIGPNLIPYLEVHFELVITRQSTMLDFHLESCGERYDTVTVKYLHD